MVAPTTLGHNTGVTPSTELNTDTLTFYVDVYSNGVGYDSYTMNRTGETFVHSDKNKDTEQFN